MVSDSLNPGRDVALGPDVHAGPDVNPGSDVQPEADGSSSPSVSVADVAKLAALARIELSPAEHERMAHELEVILGAVAEVAAVVDENTPATSHPMPLTNVFRADVVAPGLSPEEALSGAPAAESDRFRVPRILDEE